MKAKLSDKVPPEPWPALPYDEIAPTAEHIHRLAQIGGKYTLDQPCQPNWGNVMLPVTPRGFATPTLWSGNVTFCVNYEILDDRITIAASTGAVSLPLAPRTVSDTYAKCLDAFAQLGIRAPRNSLEPEIAGAPHFDTDNEARPYDAATAHRIWAAFASAARALNEWQASYRGQWPPIGIMWGGFDLYAPRYNGKTITPPSGAPVFQQNGMSAEVVAVGFSLGDAQSRAASFYAYISPPPNGIDRADFGVGGAVYNAKAGLILLPWDAVCATSDPHSTVLTFADAVYDAAVKLGGWPRDWGGARYDGWYASAHRV